MMHFEYRPELVCSTKIEFDLVDNMICSVVFTGGCDGNLKAIGKILEGQSTEFVISRLEGNTCGPKNTSCTDQLVIALKQALAQIDQ